MPDGFLQSLSGFVSECSATLKSSVKLLLASRRATIGRSAEYRRPLIVLGNGPSLKDNLLNDMDTLREHPALAVNFFANSPEFSIVRPRYYVLADISSPEATRTKTSQGWPQTSGAHHGR